MSGTAEITDGVLQRMTEHVRRTYPKEGCGLLIGDAERTGISEIRIMRNLSGPEKTGKHFIMDPLAVHRAEEEAAANGLSIQGVFHSHPDHAAALSEEDDAGMIPGLLYIILSVAKGKVLQIRGYRKAEPDGAAEEVIIKPRRDGSESIYFRHAAGLFRKESKSFADC